MFPFSQNTFVLLEQAEDRKRQESEGGKKNKNFTEQGRKAE